MPDLEVKLNESSDGKKGEIFKYKIKNTDYTFYHQPSQNENLALKFGKIGSNHDINIMVDYEEDEAQYPLLEKFVINYV